MASASAMAMPAMVGICLLSQPYVAVGAVVVIGVVVVAVAIKEELSANGSGPEEPSLGRDGRLPVSPEPADREHRPECIPRRVAPKGGNALHNKCADNIPLNAFRGANVLVNGKAFDALQPPTRTLWEVKTTAITTYNPYVRQVELDKQVTEAQRERALAAACGFDFVIGVRSEAHKQMLEKEDFSLKIVVMDWC